MTSYHMKPIYLTVLSPKAVACQVEGIASCLGRCEYLIVFKLFRVAVWQRALISIVTRLHFSFQIIACFA